MKLEENGFTVDESENAKILFGGKIAFKNFGKSPLDPCHTDTTPPSNNLCQMLVRSKTDLDELVVANIHLPEPTDLAQHLYLSAKFQTGGFFMGFFTKLEEGCRNDNLKTRPYFYMSNVNEQVKWLDGTDLWRPGEPNQCVENYLISFAEGTLADVNPRSERDVFCVYIDTSESNEQPMCSNSEHH